MPRGTRKPRAMPAAEVHSLPIPGLGELFTQFPLPLAWIDGAGRGRFNGRFSESYDSRSLDANTLSLLRDSPADDWRLTRLATRNGGTAELHVKTLPISGGTLLVFGESAAVMRDAEIDRLRNRLSELEKTSATDYLTGAWNRAHLVRVLSSEMARSERFRQPLAALLIDIDHFKHVNDTWGHQAGDAVLRELVVLIQGKIRSADLLFRWGGEEFVVLAVSTGYRDAQVFAESLRAHIAEHSFPVTGPLSASIGVAEHHGSETAQEWFARLDAALYVAKKGGRNRVVTDPRGNSDLWETGGPMHLV